MKYFEAATKILFSKDFYLTGKIIPVVGISGPIASIIFYFTCSFQGYWDSIYLRVAGALITLPLVFYPFKKDLTSFQKKYYDTVMFLILPVYFTFMFLMNITATYWFVSLMWAGIFYGLFASRAYMPLILFPVGFYLGVAIFMLYTGISTAIFLQTFGIFTISWFSSLVLGFVKLITNVFYIISLESESMRVKADEAEKNRLVLESKNAELLARNMIISTFVRPSILTEVNEGKDPRSFKPRIVDKTILICDMRNFTPLTSAMMNAEVQAQFINKYFEMMINPVFEAGGEVDKLMGDAIMAVFPDGASAVTAALEMRRRLQIYNKQLVFAGLEKIGNVISISKGYALEANIGGMQKLDRTYIGAAVNICSRLEHIAKLYGLEIIITREIFEDLTEFEECRLVDIIKVKGYHKKMEVYEVYAHSPSTVVAFKNKMKDKLQEGIRLYFKKDKMEAAAIIFKEILKDMPKHTHNEQKVMDNIVQYYAARCIDRFSQLDKEGRILNIEDGCHDFGAGTMKRDWSCFSPEEMVHILEEKQNQLHKKIDKYASSRIITP
ncbi:adenylate/guanylate cyclase domain-containing protein [Chitinispirillales bacterium ANBcel5]|uniref:adenylate/guanylate cyclase domain-containing protein n=1 Tax=Cellulosispirillum alkaliphilum TaxID=3039283 RepID=UPI002A527F74|nr:adenylate/guanylate cyclase domain-containing protein [Chitinispirillales bacterium ANBcel5]